VTEPPTLSSLPDSSQADSAAERITRYQWIVLTIACAGWIFDAFEGQLFNITREDMLRELLGADQTRLKFWGDFFLAIFLCGGALGGIAFGSLADRIGRKPVIAITILLYSLFSGLTYFAHSLWQIAALRFLVALGVGGEWAVAAALVAEIFPQRSRARAGAIFHGSSVFGTMTAAVVGMVVGVHWRYAFLVSMLPALLLFAVQTGVHEPRRWKEAQAEKRKLGSIPELFADPRWRDRAIFGLLLAAVGLGTFWSVVIAGQDLTKELLLRNGWNPQRAALQSKLAYGFIETFGMGCGMVGFGPMAERLGRRGAFLLMHSCALAIVPITCYLPQTYWQMLAILPIFGFFTGGMHAGYAIYFPELFPDHLRATGAGMCFNGGRIVAAPMLWLSGTIKSHLHLQTAIVAMSGLYFLGIVLLLFLPETKGQPLPRE
jgi:MFS family permease